jgi:hypothetical protein
MRRLLKPLLVCLLASGVAAAPGAGVFLFGFPMTADSAGSAADFEVLGGYSPAGKARWQEGKAVTLGTLNYTLWNLSGSAGTVRASPKKSYDEPCPDTYGTNVTPPPNRADWWMAVNTPWNPRPRPVTVLPNSSQPYIAVVRQYLIGKGLKNPTVKLDRVVRTDLDGDGKDEIIIAASRFNAGSGLFPPARGTAGDYAVLLVRKIIDGRVQTISLGTDVFNRTTTDHEVDTGTHNLPDAYALVGVLDLTGDGRMELVMMGAYYEGYGVLVMEWDGKKFQERLNSGCGA